MTTLDTGVLQYTLKSGEKASMFISWGYCQVHPHGVYVLAELVYKKDQLKSEQASADLKKLEDQMGSAEMTEEEWGNSQNRVKMLRAQIEFIKS